MSELLLLRRPCHLFSTPLLLARESGTPLLAGKFPTVRCLRFFSERFIPFKRGVHILSQVVSLPLRPHPCLVPALLSLCFWGGRSARASTYCSQKSVWPALPQSPVVPCPWVAPMLVFWLQICQEIQLLCLYTFSISTSISGLRPFICR